MSSPVINRPANAHIVDWMDESDVLDINSYRDRIIELNHSEAVVEVFNHLISEIKDEWKMEEGEIQRILDAVLFAAEKNRGYFLTNHPGVPLLIHRLNVACYLVSVGLVVDPDTLIVAILHGSIPENEDATKMEALSQFGPSILQEVLNLIAENDDPSYVKTLSPVGMLVLLGKMMDQIDSVNHDSNIENATYLFDYTQNIIAAVESQLNGANISFQQVKQIQDMISYLNRDIEELRETILAYHNLYLNRSESFWHTVCYSVERFIASFDLSVNPGERCYPIQSKTKWMAKKIDSRPEIRTKLTNILYSLGVSCVAIQRNNSLNNGHLKILIPPEDYRRIIQPKVKQGKEAVMTESTEMESSKSMEWIKEYVIQVPNFPKEGVNFQWFGPLLRNPVAFQKTIDAFADRYKNQKIDSIVGLDARGFIFGAALAYKMGCPFILARKQGKLPGNVVHNSYGMEYGNKTIEIERDAVKEGQNVLVVDDVFATGGTTIAACDLIEQLGGKVAEVACVIELTELEGRKKLGKYSLFTLLAT